MVSVAIKHPGGPDPTHYPVEDDVGENILQTLIVEILRPLLERWLAARGKPTFVGSDQFIYWAQYAPTKTVAPDIYVLPGIRPGTEFDSWKVWETGVVPSFALEVVSGDVRKDYEDAPRRHAELGVKELLIFDPKWASEPERVRWQIYRRLPRRGFILVERTQADRVRSRVLGCWLRSVGQGADVRIRLAEGATGDELVLTEAEVERAAKDEARAALARAQAEIARLKASSLPRKRQRR